MDLVNALSILTPNAEYTLTGDDLSGLEWLDSVISRPSDAEILAKVAEPFPPSPDWPMVRMALLNSPEYNLIAAACTDQRAVARLEVYALGSPDDWGVLATLWNKVIDSLPAPPPAEDIAAIAAILQAGHLPVTLNESSGTMVPPA